jgi:hypothetical protein
VPLVLPSLFNLCYFWILKCRHGLAPGGSCVPHLFLTDPILGAVEHEPGLRGAARPSSRSTRLTYVTPASASAYRPLAPAAWRPRLVGARAWAVVVATFNDVDSPIVSTILVQDLTHLPKVITPPSALHPCQSYEKHILKKIITVIMI